MGVEERGRGGEEPGRGEEEEEDGSCRGKMLGTH